MGFLWYRFMYLLLRIFFLIKERGVVGFPQEQALQHFYNVSSTGGGGYDLMSGRGREQVGGCNLFQGKWAYDAATNPLYDSLACPFISGEFDCLKYGRPDKQFLKFDGGYFLRRWRGKRIMFVGDSLSLNMWESLSCMIHSSVPNAKTSFVRKDSMSSVIFKDYGMSLMLYRTPYLVDIVRQNVGRVLMLDSINAGNTWKDMDVLIFNSWHWWIHKGSSSQGWDYIQDGNKLVTDMDRLDAFYKGMSTWARWVNANVDTTKTKVFFQGISPTHDQGRDRNSSKKNCFGELQPVLGSTYPTGAPPAVGIVNRVLSTIKKPVYLLDITTLSQLRKDAHPSQYTGEHAGNDCNHWCLPGLPDTWNQLLYAALIM